MSDSLRPHGWQHARPPCPSPTPEVYSSSCPSRCWCHQTISSSVVPFSSLLTFLQSFSASGSVFSNESVLPISWPNIGVSASASVLPVVRREYNFLSSVLSQQKFEVTDQRYSPRTDHVTALRQISVTALFYLENKGNTSSRLEGMPTQKTRGKRREGARDPWPFGSSFYMFFLLPLGLPCVHGASQECCLFHLRSSVWSSDLPLFYFWGLSPCLLATAILDPFFLF